MALKDKSFLRRKGSLRNVDISNSLQCNSFQKVFGFLLRVSDNLHLLGFMFKTSPLASPRLWGLDQALPLAHEHLYVCWQSFCVQKSQMPVILARVVIKFNLILSHLLKFKFQQNGVGSLLLESLTRSSLPFV
jgi:hypothetical protein